MKLLYLILPALFFVSCKTEKYKVPAGATPTEVTETEQMPEEPVIEEPVSEEEPIVVLGVPAPEIDSLVGQKLETVKPALEAAEIRFRVVEQDGEPFIVTMDFNPDRLNFKIKDGVIIAVSKG